MNRIGQLTVPAILLAFVIAGCHSNQTATQNQSQAATPGQDPAAANLANASNVTATGQTPSAAAPDQTDTYAAPAGGPQDNGYYSEANDQETADDVAPDPPPDLPDYDQPAAPGDNYVWTPGYWSWSNQGYYWVPGAWVLAPYVGALWTPGYWDYESGRYRFHHGYWGRHVGYYGGVNYGFGYDGNGYEGGYWRGNDFYYNRDVSHVDTRSIHNTYNYRVQNRYNTSHVSYDGGRGGLNFRPTAQQMTAQHEQHMAAMPVQQEMQQSSRSNRAQFAGQNHGRPQTLAETRAVSGGQTAPASSPEAFHPIAGPNRPAPMPSGRNVPGHIGPAPMARPQPGLPGPAAPSRQPATHAPPRNQPESGTTPIHPEAQPSPRRSNQQPEARPSPQPAPQQRPHAQPAPQQRPETRPEQQRPQPGNQRRNEQQPQHENQRPQDRHPQ